MGGYDSEPTDPDEYYSSATKLTEAELAALRREVLVAACISGAFTLIWLLSLVQRKLKEGRRS